MWFKSYTFTVPVATYVEYVALLMAILFTVVVNGIQLIASSDTTNCQLGVPVIANGANVNVSAVALVWLDVNGNAFPNIA